MRRRVIGSMPVIVSPQRPGTLRAGLAVAAKDLRIELRSKDALNPALAFSLVMLVLFSFAFDPTAEQTRALGGGLLWLVFAFGGMLILDRSFARELPNDCLDALLAAPLPAAGLYLGKAVANWLLLMAVELVALVFFGVFYNAAWTRQFWAMVGVVALGSWALSAVGTMFGALTVNLRLRELMLPLLLYPVLIPALLAAAQLSGPLAVGEPLGPDMMVWLRLLAAFDLVFTALALALAETVLTG